MTGLKTMPKIIIALTRLIKNFFILYSSNISFSLIEKMGLTTCFQYKTNLKGRSDQRIFIGVDTQ